MELILICASIRSPIFLLRRLFKCWPKQMSSFEVLSWGSLKKLSLFAVERDSFDLVFKPSEDPDSFRVTLSQLEKPIKYLTKFSCKFLEPLVFKCNLLLLRFLLASIALWLMNGIFTSLRKIVSFPCLIFFYYFFKIFNFAGIIYNKYSSVDVTLCNVIFHAFAIIVVIHVFITADY